MENTEITKIQFEDFMEELKTGRYVLTNKNINIETPEKWESLSFKYDRRANNGLDFELDYPYSCLKDGIDYDVIMLRFVVEYPFPQEWGYRISDKEQVKCLKDFLDESILKKNFGSV